MAVYMLPEIPELTGKDAADFIKKAESPAPARVSAMDWAIYRALTQKLPDQKS